MEIFHAVEILIIQFARDILRCSRLCWRLINFQAFRLKYDFYYCEWSTILSNNILKKRETLTYGWLTFLPWKRKFSHVAIKKKKGKSKLKQEQDSFLTTFHSSPPTTSISEKKYNSKSFLRPSICPLASLRGRWQPKNEKRVEWLNNDFPELFSFPTRRRDVNMAGEVSSPFVSRGQRPRPACYSTPRQK